MATKAERPSALFGSAQTNTELRGPGSRWMFLEAGSRDVRNLSDRTNTQSGRDFVFGEKTKRP